MAKKTAEDAVTRVGKITVAEMRPGPRFEPGSEDPQSSRITNYPTLANSLLHWQWSLFKVSFWKVASTHDAG